jgi:DNA-binding NarL/FixJ family response regulator
MVKVLVIEGQPALRRGLEYLLSSEADLQIVGSAPDCFAALLALPALQPDVVIFDIDCASSIEQTSLAALRQIGASSRVIVLTFFDRVWSRQLSCESGGPAVILKDVPATALLAAIRDASPPT